MVESQPSKLLVASSILVSRSNKINKLRKSSGEHSCSCSTTFRTSEKAFSPDIPKQKNRRADCARRPEVTGVQFQRGSRSGIVALRAPAQCLSCVRARMRACHDSPSQQIDKSLTAVFEPAGIVLVDKFVDPGLQMGYLVSRFQPVQPLREFGNNGFNPWRSFDFFLSLSRLRSFLNITKST